MSKLNKCVFVAAVVVGIGISLLCFSGESLAGGGHIEVMRSHFVAPEDFRL